MGICLFGDFPNYDQDQAISLASGLYVWIDNLYIPQDQAGEQTFMVTVTDSSGRTAEKQFVLPIESPLMMTTQSLPHGIVGEPYKPRQRRNPLYLRMG